MVHVPLMFRSEWREFPSAPCLAEKKNLMTVRVSMLLKLRASLTCFRSCFLPGRAKELSAPRYWCCVVTEWNTLREFTIISEDSAASFFRFRREKKTFLQNFGEFLPGYIVQTAKYKFEVSLSVLFLRWLKGWNVGGTWHSGKINKFIYISVWINLKWPRSVVNIQMGE